MIKHAWSLVFFTVLGQLGAGLYVMHKLMALAGRFSAIEIDSGSKKFIILSFIISMLALLISFSHLGQAKNAIYALSNFRTSWLSREIFFLSAFIATLLFELIFTRSPGYPVIRDAAVSIIGVAAALAFVFSMIRLYQLETVPAWNTAYTFLHFYNSALLGGTILLVLINTIKLPPTSMYVILVLAALQLILYYFSTAPATLFNALPFLFYGVILVLVFLHVLTAIPEQSGFYVTILCFALFTAGLLMERYQFYASYQSIGL